jgi:periplasmic nitrate reductase NapD
MSSSLSGAIVHVDPARIEEVKGKITSFSGVEIHAIKKGTKIVITIEESGGNKFMADTLVAIQNIDGVYQASLVYEYSGDDLDD